MGIGAYGLYYSCYRKDPDTATGIPQSVNQTRPIPTNTNASPSHVHLQANTSVRLMLQRLRSFPRILRSVTPLTLSVTPKTARGQLDRSRRIRSLSCPKSMYLPTLAAGQREVSWDILLRTREYLRTDLPSVGLTSQSHERELHTHDPSSKRRLWILSRMRTEDGTRRECCPSLCRGLSQIEKRQERC